MASRTIIQPSHLFKPTSPYSLALRSNNLIFTAGMLSLDEAGNAVGQTAYEQTTNILSAISDLLEEGGASISSIVKTTIFLADECHFTEMNRSYQAFFRSEPPPRSTVVVKLLKPEWLVEIEAIAVANAK